VNQLLDFIATPGTFLLGALLTVGSIVGLILLATMRRPRGCPCPRYLLRRQLGGMVWKTYHRPGCEEFGT
jgi:hypothetical protein